MELLSVFKADNQRLFITQIFPGALAFWPFALMIANGIGVETDIYMSVEWTSIIGIFVYLLVASAVGLLIEDIGGLFELKLEKIYFKIKTIDRSNKYDNDDPLFSKQTLLSLLKHLFAFPTLLVPSYSIREWLFGNHIRERKMQFDSADIEKKFYSRWKKYLELCYTKDSEPVVIRYYRSVLVRFKFELNTSAALMAMLVGHLVLMIRMHGIESLLQIINWPDTILYAALITFTISILLTEAFKGIELLDDLRLKAVRGNNRSIAGKQPANKDVNKV
jgi:hypothetical protein